MRSLRAMMGDESAPWPPCGATQPGSGCQRPFVARALLGLVVLSLACVADAQDTPAPGALSSIPWPGPLTDSLASLDDRAAPDRSQFLLELIRRSHRTPIGASDPNDPIIRALISRLDPAGTPALAAARPDTLPLPLPPEVWIEAVLGGRATLPSLAGAIVQSRSAALFYYGLLWLDEPTRTWLAGQRELITDLSSKFAAPFVLAAPALRVSPDGRLSIPGGPAAEAAWLELTGRPVTDPAAFLRALLAAHEGRLAYFFGAIGQLTPLQQRVALDLDAESSGRRLASARRLHEVFERIGRGWTVDARVFWRPALDPALLLTDLPVSRDGRPVIPGTRRFWEAVLADDAPRPGGVNARPAPDASPLEFAWLSEQIFDVLGDDQRQRYRQVLFASRLFAANASARPPSFDDEAIEAVRAIATFPALVAVLERAKVTTPAVYAQTARRAATLAAIEDEAQAVRAITQFQGAVALVTRAAAQSGWTATRLADTLTSLSAVETSPKGDYEGRLVTWIADQLPRPAGAAPKAASAVADPGAPAAEALDEVLATAAGPIERDLLAWLAGPPDRQPRFVEWEGTRYRVDLVRAEAIRLTRLLGEQPRPYLTSALALVKAADALAARPLAATALRELAELLARVSRDVAWDDEEVWPGAVLARHRELAAALGPRKPAGGASRLAPLARALADDSDVARSARDHLRRRPRTARPRLGERP